jgi:putative ABC transport system permease protein
MIPGLWPLIAWRLRRQLPGDRVEPILLDLLEDYAARRRTSGFLRSGLWLLREAGSLEVAYRTQARAQREPRRSWLDALWQDTRISCRSLMRAPGVTATITITLAIGIGANTAIFAIVNGVLLQPLPYPDAGRLVSITHRSPGSRTDIPSAPYLYFTYRDTARTIERVGLWQAGTSTITGLDRPEQVQRLFVTHEILPLLGIAPLAGRTFSEADDVPGSPVAVMVSWGYWQRRFGGDASAVGRPLTIDGMAGTVVGVLPRTFRFLDRPVDVIYLFQLDPALVQLGRYVFPSLARLKPGVTIASATADLAGVVPRAIERFPPPAGYTRDRFAAKPVTPYLTPLKDEVVGDVGRTLWIVMGALGVVLIIACANIAHLLLVRADGRRREFAVRVALGASPSRIVAGLLVEGVLLGLTGGAAGLLVAYAGLSAILAFGPANLPRAQDIAIDPLALSFTLAISLASGVWLGLIPVLKLTGRRTSLAPSLTDGGRTMSDGRERQRTRGALVVAQVALALVLLVCSGLMIRTFQTLTRVEPGFANPEEVQLVSITAGGSDPDQTTRTQHAIVDALAAIPGVTSVGFGDRSPLGADNRGGDTVLTVEGSTRVEGQPRPLRRFQFISPAYFRTLGTPIVTGRELEWRDLDERRQVAIVSAGLAREEWGSAAGALGKRVQVTPADPWREIVGVAGDLRDNGMHEPAPPIIYFPARVDRFWGAPQISFGAVTFAVRSTRAGSESLLREIEQSVSRVNASLPVSQIRRLSDVYRASLARTSFTLTMLLIAGAMGLLLGVIGIYGVVAYGVSQRTREIGIRLALGAQPPEVTRLFIRRGVALASIGLVAGLIAAFPVTRLMSSLLVGVSPVDPLTYGAVAAIVLTVVTGAAYVPARRAARRGPIDALRQG